MSGPIYGGQTSLVDSGASEKGIYSNHPAATPKYNADSHLGSLQTQARLYIDIPDPIAYERFLDAVPLSARDYAKTLARTSGGGGGRGYLRFLLTAASEPLSERVQVSQVLADSHIAYFYGQQSPVWTYQIGLMNSQQDEWYDAWHVVYNEIIRGTQAARRGVAVTLAYDTRRITGSIMQQQTSLNAQNEIAVQGGFSLLVKRVNIDVPVLQDVPGGLSSDSSQIAGGSALPAAMSGVTQSVTVADTTATLAAQRSRALDGSESAELAASLRPGFSPAEVLDKTGVNAVADSTVADRTVGGRALPPAELL